MTEIENLLNGYKHDDLREVELFELIELLIFERKAYLRLREDLKKAAYELDDACAHHEIDVCHKKMAQAINRIIGDL